MLVRMNVVGCRGGSRNVQGVLGIALLENRKVDKCQFHVFDQYEIHIQDLVDFISPIFIIFRSSSSESLTQE